MQSSLPFAWFLVFFPFAPQKYCWQRLRKVCWDENIKKKTKPVCTHFVSSSQFPLAALITESSSDCSLNDQRVPSPRVCFHDWTSKTVLCYSCSNKLNWSSVLELEMEHLASWKGGSAVSQWRTKLLLVPFQLLGSLESQHCHVLY